VDSRAKQTPAVGHTRQRGRRGVPAGKPRSLPIAEWPAADREGWEEACRPGERLTRGGSASHLAPVSRADIANRYGLYLDHLQRHGWLDPAMSAKTLVTPDSVNAFVAELKARVRSVTVWNSVYKLRRAAQLIVPGRDFGWLTEIEKDVALVMEPRPKADRLVLAERLVEAGVTLIREAEMFSKTAHARATGVRNGLLIVLLALHPIRVKNFAALTIGNTFVNVDGRWWLHIPSDDTKSKRLDQRQVPEFITDLVDSYIDRHRPILCRFDAKQTALWISSTTGLRLTTKNLGTLVSKITRNTIGVDVSPHLFRTAGASTAAIYGGGYAHLASDLLGHRDQKVTDEHYNRSMGLSSGEEYGAIAQLYRQRTDGSSKKP
jgi:integrase